MCIVVNQKKKKNDNDIEAYFYFYLQFSRSSLPVCTNEKHYCVFLGTTKRIEKKKLFRTWGELQFGLLEPDSNESFFFSCSFNLQFLQFFFCFMIVCFFVLCYVHLVSFNSQERQCDNSIGSEFLFTQKKVSGMFKYMHRNTMCLGISSNCDDTNLHLLITGSNDKRCLFKKFRRLWNWYLLSYCLN